MLNKALLTCLIFLNLNSLLAQDAIFVKDINPGFANSYPKEIIDFNGEAIFHAYAGPTIGVTLWKSDGTSTGTVQIIDLHSATNPWNPFGTKISGTSNFLFFADNGTTGLEPWISDGTTAGTNLILDINNGSDGSWIPSSIPNKEIFFNNVFYFTAFDTTNKPSKLWRTDGTSAGTYIISSNFSNKTLEVGGEIVEFKGKMMFPGYLPSTGDELFESDGTTSGTSLFLDLFPGSTGASYKELTVVGNQLYFVVNSAELWTTDGSQSGTRLVKDFLNLNGNPEELTNVDGLLMFKLGKGIWKSDGTLNGTVKVKEESYWSSNHPEYLKSVGGLLFFRATRSASSSSTVVWRSDGTSSNTFSLPSGIKLSSSGSHNGIVFGDEGGELYKTDGSAAGSALVEDIWPGFSSSEPSNFCVVGNRLFFEAKDANFGGELFMLDCAPSKTILYDTACAGDTVVINGNSVTKSGMFRVSKSNTPSGCDIITDKRMTFVTKQIQIRGKVYKNDSSLLSNETVYFKTINKTDSSLVKIDSVTTDSLGKYSFDSNVEPIYVYVNPDPNTNQLPTYMSSSLIHQFSDKVEFDNCDISPGDIKTLASSVGSGSGSIGGKIIVGGPKSIGDPVVNLQVFIEGNNGERVITTTDNDGYFIAANLPMGSYNIYLDKPYIDNNAAPIVTLDNSNQNQDNLKFLLRPTVLDLVGLLGVETTQSHDFVFYPNPIKQKLYLEIPENIKSYTVKVLDMMGRSLIKESNENVIDLENLSSGQYILRFVSSNKVQTEHIIKD